MDHSYRGGCLCGAVQFEVELDLTAPSSRARTVWEHEVAPSAFRLLTGEGQLTGYQFWARAVHHFYCGKCGAHAFSRGLGTRYEVSYVVDLRALHGRRREPSGRDRQQACRERAVR